MVNFRSISFLFLLVGLASYSYWFSQNDEVWIVPHVSDRTPAAVKDTEEFKKLIETPIKVFKREAATKTIKIGKKESYTYFAMKQFAVDSKKGKNLICIEYPYLRLKFLAEGISVGDQKPVAWVSAPCMIDQSQQTELTYIPLPFGKLERLPAEDHEREFQPNGVKVNLKFEAIINDWPSLWQLQQIEFMREPGSDFDSLIIGNEEIIKALGHPVLVNHE